MLNIIIKKSVTLTVFVSILYSISYANDGDTTKINFYTKYDLQQWKGTWWHKKLAYLDPAKKYKKAYLSVKLGCASYGCCVWDYNFHNYIIKPLPGNDTLKFGKKDTVTGNSVTVVLDSNWITRKSTNYEIGRLITPYGTYMRANSNGFTNNTWEHPYIYDVTDYLPLLKDSFGIGIESGGYDGKKGFSATVDLILIEGSSNYQPSQIYVPYQKGYSYKNELQIDSITKAFKFKLTPNETTAKFRSIVTAHGQEGEFSPIEYRIKVNGNTAFTKRLWRTDCDKTYVQPQGGTWIFSRCNWCPGEIVETFELDLSPYLIKTDSNEVDISFGAIESTSATITANYVIAGHVITYSKKDDNDLALEEILSPSKNPSYLHLNALCQGPTIKIKNNGHKPIKEAYIDYWIVPENKTTFIWKGLLKAEESAIVNLPSFPWNEVNSSSPIFYASLQKTKENMVTWNDTLKSNFILPPTYSTSAIKLEIRSTNENVNSNKITIYNELGDTAFTKTYPTNGTLITETIALTDGCYRLEVIDFESRYECGDGLSFWLSETAAPNGLGKSKGSIRILNQANTELKKFNPDFGGLLNHQFTINKQIGLYEAKSEYNYQEYKFPDTVISSVLQPEKFDFEIFPNPTENKSFTINCTKQRTSATLKIMSLDGKVVFSKLFKSGIDTELINLEKLSSGTYKIILKIGSIEKQKTLLLKQ